MSSIAVIIGIDAYAADPLTSAVNDALDFRRTLCELGLVDPSEVVLLTAPARDGAQGATRGRINQVLKEVHDRGSRAQRLYFFYAGHGLSAYADAARAVAETALIPPEVGDLAADANLLINFDDLRHRLERAGPAEQFFLFDACRDLAFGERPGNLPSLGWPASPEPSPGPTAQAALFAVSPGGRALGVPQGLGVMTQHLIDALHGRGIALDFSDESEQYVVTAESVTRHVQARVMGAVGGHEGWRHQVMLPELRPTGRPLEPLRVVENPPEPELTLEFDPQDAAADTTVRLKLRGNSLAVPRWPPCRHGQPVRLDPLVYRIVAQSRRGVAAADRRGSTCASSTARRSGSPKARRSRSAPTSRSPEGPPSYRRPRVVSARQGAGATVHASAQEPGATVELLGQEPPYRRWEVAGELLQDDVPPGSYVVRFRLGPEVFGEVDLDLLAGDLKTVIPGGARSPLLAETGAPTADGTVVLSLGIGPMHSSALLTALPLVGRLPFDPDGELFERLRPAVPRLDFAAFDERPVRVVVAAEGDGWSDSPRAVATGLTCELVAPDGVRERVALEPLADEETGWGRVVHGTATAPGASFVVCLRSPHLGTIELAAAALRGRVTVIGLAPTPDGRLDVVQHLLRVPGREYRELVPHIPDDRLVRELVLGQRLYEGGELLDVEAADAPGAQLLGDLLRAKWTDPILGCMAYYAWSDAVARGLREQPGAARTTARNLSRYFAELPDARVIAALAGLPDATPVRQALAPGELPVLARTLRACAQASGSGFDPARRWAGHVAPESTWTLVWRPDPSATALADVIGIATA